MRDVSGGRERDASPGASEGGDKRARPVRRPPARGEEEEGVAKVFGGLVFDVEGGGGDKYLYIYIYIRENYD